MKEMRKKISGTTTVSSILLSDFNRDILNYVTLLNKSLRKDTLFGKEIKAPVKNINDIVKDYVKKSTNELVKQGLKVQRARSISRCTIEKSLEYHMNIFENQENY